MPLILHNVPDEERYTGEDGLRRPYAVIFGQYDSLHPPLFHAYSHVESSKAAQPANDSKNRNESVPPTGTRSRRTVAESGSFGKSTRRSRSRTATPSRSAREDPTLAGAEKMFSGWVMDQAQLAGGSAKKTSHDDAASKRTTTTAATATTTTTTPTELILRGYRSPSQQYAAVSHYEELAGLILEDYPRDPPASQRRYKSDLRDPAYTRRRNLTPAERALVNRADGGEHWVKVTFESADAANAVLHASPQRILGHLVYAECYRGSPPARDEACPSSGNAFFPDDFSAAAAASSGGGGGLMRSQSVPVNVGEVNPRRVANSFGGAGLPQSFSSRLLDLTAPETRRSSETLDSATLPPPSAASTATATALDSAVATGGASSDANKKKPAAADLVPAQDSIFCSRIPTARRARLLPAEQALLPQQSVVQRFVGAVPFIGWFGGSMIGSEVPRTEAGEFDWNRASLYWKIIWWLDATFGLFNGDLCCVDKDE